MTGSNTGGLSVEPQEYLHKGEMRALLNEVYLVRVKWSLMSVDLTHPQELRNIYAAFVKNLDAALEGDEFLADSVPPYVLDLVRSVTTGEPLDFHRHQVPTLIRDTLTEAFSPSDSIGNGVTESEHLERIERQRGNALATIEGVKALCNSHDRIGFVTVEVILAALDEQP